MTERSLERGMEIQDRILKLQNAHTWLNSKESRTYLNVDGYRFDAAVFMSNIQKNVLDGLVIAEINELREEFKKL